MTSWGSLKAIWAEPEPTETVTVGFEGWREMVV